MLDKVWTQRLNLIFGALCMAYGIKTWLLFTSGYDGYVPEPQPGMYIMLAGCIGHMIAAGSAMALVKRVEPSGNPADKEGQPG